MKIQRFQIYELVTALILLALFLALVFFQANATRRQGIASNCTGQLKQLGSASALYAGDNLGAVPGPQPWGTSQPLFSWDRPVAIQMGAGIKMAEPLAALARKPASSAYRTLMTFTCSNDPLCDGARQEPRTPGSLDDGLAAGKGICRSYTLNLGSGNLVAGQDDGIARDAQQIPVAKIEIASETAYLVENHGYATVFGQRNIANDTTLACSRKGEIIPADAFTNAAAGIHGIPKHPRANMLMHDGHVEFLDQDSLTSDGGDVLQYLKTVPEGEAKEETP